MRSSREPQPERLMVSRRHFFGIPLGAVAMPALAPQRLRALPQSRGKRIPRVMPLLAVVLLAAACSKDDGGPTTSGGTATVRFFNATTGMTGSGGFTTNGRFATGSALAFGQSTQTCSPVDAGSTSFGFGAASTGGTSLSGSALATLNNQSVTDGGNFTVAATGSATSPTLFLLDNGFPGSLTTSQAAVRFVNLAPGTGTTPNAFNVFLGTFGSGQSLVATDIAVGAPTTFKTVTSGNNTFSVLQGHNIIISGSAFTLQAGTVNTLAIVLNTTTGSFQLIDIPGC